MHGISMILSEDGPVWFGVTDKPELELARLLRKHAGKGFKIKETWELGKSEAAMVIEIASRDIGRRFKRSDDWWGAPAKEVSRTIHTIVTWVLAEPPVGDSEHGMKSLRVDYFHTTQEQFAKIAGVSLSQVSRWESGHQEPSWTALSRLYNFSLRLGLPWPNNTNLLSTTFCGVRPAQKVIPTEAKDNSNAKGQSQTV